MPLLYKPEDLAEMLCVPLEELEQAWRDGPDHGPDYIVTAISGEVLYPESAVREWIEKQPLFRLSPIEIQDTKIMPSCPKCGSSKVPSAAVRLLVFLFAMVAWAQPYNLVPTGTLTHNASGVSGFAPGNYYTMPAGPLNNTCTTIEAWVNPANVSTWQWVLNNYNGTVPTHSLGFLTGGNIYGQIGSGVVNGHVLSTGVFQHLAVQQCSGTVTIFVDGIQRGSTSSTGPFAANTVARIGQNLDGNETWSGSFRHLAIWSVAKYTACGNGNTCFTPATSYVGNEANLRAYYPLTTNGNDAATGGAPLSASMTLGAGWVVTIAGGTAPYTAQRQSYAGACASGTFANEGSAVTGLSAGTTAYASTDTTTRCVRYVITDSAGGSVNTTGVTTPTANVTVFR